MKKVFLFSIMCLMAIAMNAQRCAVMEFKARVGISQADVDGISGIFITYFRPAGYTMVERTQIDRIIDEQGYQRSSMTETQMVRIGEILNVSKIVIGDVNIVMGQYNVDVRVINVESGTIAATEGATFTASDYRSSMRSLAQNLAAQIAITAGTTVQAQQTSSQQYVDLGLPSGTLWKTANEKGGFYTYDEAVSNFGDELPTQEQWEELKGMCDWQWTGRGYKVTGDNGNSIVLPAAGDRNCRGDVGSVGSFGSYWSSTPYPYGSESAWSLYFTSGEVGTSMYIRCSGRYVRLVQD